MADGYVGLFKVPDQGSIVPVTNDVTAMAMAVTEDYVEGKNLVQSKAIVDITNVDLQTTASGAEITTVILEHKLSSAGTYENVGSYSVNWTGLDNSVKIDAGVQYDWNKDGVDHDFRAYFQNGDGQLAQESDGDIIGVDVFLESLDNTFNGIDDLSEYPEVSGLEASNASDIEGGTFASPANLPKDGIVTLSWRDMRNMPDVVAWPLGDGSTQDITTTQWKNLEGYKAYMYVADSAIPDVEYPDPSEAQGTWYLSSEIGPGTNTVDIDCPYNAKVSFWVGVVGISSGIELDPIPRVAYAQYYE